MKTSQRLLTAKAFAAAIMFATAQASGADTAPVKATASIHADRPGPVIHRYIFGQFAEFVGRVFREGIWVGEKSSIPNTRGFRNDVVAALKDIRVPLVRWPGGCYADLYNWRDGIGPKETRPKRISPMWGGVIEDNAVGTHEYFDFLEQIGADAYVNGNIGSGSPREMAEWIEYMTSDTGSTLANERRRNGRDKPYKIAMFGVGNETWGCGGHMRPEYAADLHNRYATFLFFPPFPDVLNPVKPPPNALIVASGANADDYEFTRGLMAGSAKHMDAYTFHYYTLPGGKFGTFGPALAFPESDWAITLKRTLRMEEMVTKHAALMDAVDPAKRIGLYVDEWGTWYDPTPGTSFAYQQNTVRDAVIAAVNLNIFARHADRVRMTSIAQIANVLQSVILTDREKMVLTPTYHVFKMYLPFQDATFIPLDLSSPEYVLGDVKLPAVDGIAAKAKNGAVYIALVNLDPKRSARVETTGAGVSPRGTKGQVLTATQMDGHNDFDHPNAVVPRAFAGRIENGKLVFDLPAKSVAVVEITQ